MPHLKGSTDKHGPHREAPKVNPASYHSFIDLTTPHHHTKPRNQLSRGHSHRRVRKTLQVVDRPYSFLDLGESDARISYQPPYTAALTFKNARDTGVVGINVPPATTRNCKEQGRLGGRDTDSVRVSSCDPAPIGGVTGHRTPHSARQAYDVSSGKMAPYSPRTPGFLEDNRLPHYEEATAPAPVNFGEKTTPQFASEYTGNSYCTKRPLSRPSQDAKLCTRDPVVVFSPPPAYRAFRPLPPIPSSDRTDAHFTTTLDDETQSLHVDDLNIAPPISLSKMEQAPLRKR